MKRALVLVAAFAYFGCTSPNDVTGQVCATGAYRCDSSSPAQLQICALDSWTANPECDLACGGQPAGQVVATSHYACTCLGGTSGSRCDSAH